MILNWLFFLHGLDKALNAALHLNYKVIGLKKRHCSDSLAVFSRHLSVFGCA
jgi:hypothetical protein